MSLFTPDPRSHAYAVKEPRCGWCHWPGKTRIAVEEHEKEKHKGKFVCTCDAEFETSGSLRKHAKRLRHQISTSFMLDSEKPEKDETGGFEKVD